MLTLLDDDASASRPSAVAIGVFDGLHRGHQVLLGQLHEIAARQGAAPTVVTFDPSPAQVLAPERAPRMLATLAQRLEALAALGVAQTRVLTFNEHLAQESAGDFVERVLVGELGATSVVVGEDFHFGHARGGSVALLRELGPSCGFDVVAASLAGDGERWSSSAVRRALTVGDVEAARAVLGRPFTLRGDVVHGDQRGEGLGFRTANLGLAPRQLLPSDGVYAGATAIEGRWFAAAISVGRRPQFYEDGELLVEVHVLDFDGDLYDRTLDVVFLARRRDQATFDHVEALTAQIGRDVAATREIFAQFSPSEAGLLGWTLGQRR